MARQPLFLPYQQRWLKDRSRIKLWVKSRRIGATYVQAYEDVHDAIRNVGKTYFSSADDSAGAEYIDYCAHWARLANCAAKALGLELLDEERDILARRLELANGSTIYALSSNPKRFRSKGGKIVLDEFAWHDDQRALWAAAKPSITWGHDLRLLSTLNGGSNLFAQFRDQCTQGRLGWSLHTTTIQQAVAEGLADKIRGRRLTEAERAAWLTELAAETADHEAWLQEYCCIPQDEAAALLHYDLLRSRERPDILWAPADLASGSGDLYLGMDVGRKKDLTVLWLLERCGPVLVTRLVEVLERTPFAEQRQRLDRLLCLPGLRRACLDATGLGMQLAEEAQTKHGRYKVEQVTFTGSIKEALAYGLRAALEDARLWLPQDDDCREDLHSVRKSVTAANHVRLDVAATDSRGHADRFWACALAVEAAGSVAAPLYVASGLQGRTRQLLSGYA